MLPAQREREHRWKERGEPDDQRDPSDRTVNAGLSELLRKEVIQPQVPLRLPCYDFTPIIGHTVGVCLLAVGANDFRYNKLSWCDGRCVQGPGTYSPRRADPGLLAIPPSRGRVADLDLN